MYPGTAGTLLGGIPKASYCPFSIYICISVESCLAACSWEFGWDKIESIDQNSTADEFQTAIFSVAKESIYKENIKDFFKLIYEVVFGQDNGPRLGSFIKVYTKEKTLNLINSKLNV